MSDLIEVHFRGHCGQCGTDADVALTYKEPPDIAKIPTVFDADCLVCGWAVSYERQHVASKEDGT